MGGGGSSKCGICKSEKPQVVYFQISYTQSIDSLASLHPEIANWVRRKVQDEGRSISEIGSIQGEIIVRFK